MQGYNYSELYAALQAWPYKSSAVYLANLNRMIFMGELRLVRDLDLEIFDVADTLPVTPGTTMIAKPPYSQPINFTGAIAQGATAGTLLADWMGATGTYTVTFSDNEVQAVLLMKGQVAASWALPMANAVSAAARVSSTFVAERSLWSLYKGLPKKIVKRSYDFVQSHLNAPWGKPAFYCDSGTAFWIISPAPDANVAYLIRRYISRPVSIVAAGSTWLGDNVGDVLFAACLMESEAFLKADDRYADMKMKYEQELLPDARGEIMVLGRRGMYNPLSPVASTPQPQAPQPAPQQQ